MKTCHTFVTLSLAALGLMASPHAASAYSLSHLDTDTDYNALIDQLSFVPEGRIGSNSIGGTTYELDIHDIVNNNFVLLDQDEFVWSNGTATPFTLAYQAATQNVSYTVGGKTLTSTATGPFTDILIRTRATKPNSKIEVNNLFLNGLALNNSSIADANGDSLDYLRIRGLSDKTDFLLTGQSIMSWLGATPSQSQLAYQIKVGTTVEGPLSESESVPEPASMSLFSLIVGGIAWMRSGRRRKQKA